MGYSKNKDYYKTKGEYYNVYDKLGNKVSEDDYEYVELYTDFYAGVDKDQLVYIYDYNGNKLTEKGVKVVSKTYSRTDNPSFKVIRKDGKYTISVLENNEYKEYPTYEEPTPEEPVNPPEPVNPENPENPEKPENPEGNE